MATLAAAILCIRTQIFYKACENFALGCS